MRELLYVLFGGILLGCTDRYMDDESMNMVKSERAKVVRLADLSRNGIYDVSGFIKQGNKIIVGATYMKEGVARALDLENPVEGDLSSGAINSSKRLRALSSFNSFDGKSVTALDFKTGELIESIGRVDRTTSRGRTTLDSGEDKRFRDLHGFLRGGALFALLADGWFLPLLFVLSGLPAIPGFAGEDERDAIRQQRSTGAP